MNTYRQKQLAAAALIESGSYTAEQIAEIYGWTARTAPERSEPQRTKPKRKRKRKLFRIIRRLLE